MLAGAGVDAAGQDAAIDQLCRAPADAGRDGADRAMLAFGLKLTQTPASMTADDVRALREAGFEDPAIHDICAIVAYFAFVNRLADGLGVELEARFGRATAAL